MLTDCKCNNGFSGPDGGACGTGISVCWTVPRSDDATQRISVCCAPCEPGYMRSGCVMFSGEGGGTVSTGECVECAAGKYKVNGIFSPGMYNDLCLDCASPNTVSDDRTQCVAPGPPPPPPTVSDCHRAQFDEFNACVAGLGAPPPAVSTLCPLDQHASCSSCTQSFPCLAHLLLSCWPCWRAVGISIGAMHLPSPCLRLPPVRLLRRYDE